MTKFHFQPVLDVLSHRTTDRKPQHNTPPQQKFVVSTHTIVDSKIVVSNAPKNTTELAQFLHRTLYDSQLPISCLAAVNTDPILTRYMWHPSTQMASLQLKKTSIDINYDFLLFVNPSSCKSQLTITANDHNSKNLTAFHFQLDSIENIIGTDDYLKAVYDLFKQLQGGNNIAIYSPSTTGVVVHIVVALCLLSDFDNIFNHANPEKIADNILKRTDQISHNSGLTITPAKIIDAVKVADCVFTRNRQDFMLQPQHIVKPYTGMKSAINEEQMGLLSEAPSSQSKRKGLALCSLV